jgi:hypothetical protein
MKNTASLLLRDIITKLHPPAPATARDSAKLLTLLNKSFRKQLDEAHPAPLARPVQHNDGPEAIRSTTSHLDSVLHHPLLEHHSHARGLDHSTAVPAFEAALRDNDLTVSTLSSICKQYLAEIKFSPHTTRSQLGPRIAAWMSSADVRTKTMFLLCDWLYQHTVPVLYADGLESEAWSWLKALYQRDWLPSSLTVSPADQGLFQDAEDKLVSEMMRMALKRNSILDATHQYVQASTYRIASAKDQAVPLKPLLSAYRRISSAILYRRHNHGISASLFDQLLKASPAFTANHKVVGGSILNLYHPTTPSAQHLFNDLRSDFFTEPWVAWHTKQPILHRSLLLAILDAAELSLKQNHSFQAAFFLDHAHKYWPDAAPAVAAPTPDDAQSIRERITAVKENLSSRTIWSDRPSLAHG